MACARRMLACFVILVLLFQAKSSTGVTLLTERGARDEHGDGGPDSAGACSETCYKQATCNEQLGGRCDCPKHLSQQPDCMVEDDPSRQANTKVPLLRRRLDPPPCLNNCTRRGVCVHGDCVCSRGQFGSDCSLSLDPAGHLALLAGSGYKPRARRPLVYVYDIPHKYSSWYNPKLIDRHTHWVFWERLLVSGTLTPDGDDADWFFIPAKLRNTHDGELLLDAIQYIRTRWPWYNRTHGHRHFVFHVGDLGRGEVVDDVMRATENVTWLHHWGLTVRVPAARWRAAHRPGKDVVVPIYFRGGKTTSTVSVSGLHPRAPRLPRDKTLLFAGRICGDYSLPDPAKPWPHCKTTNNDVYSQGVRQMVHFHHHNRTGYKIVVKNPHYQLDLLSHKWCLAPSGGGHGHRQALVSITGCLPLIISDTVYQPFEPEMDWNRFGMRLTHADIPTLHEALEAVDEAALERRRDALMCAAQHLAYSGSSGAFMQEDGRWDAFEFILEILRMQQTYPGLDPRRYADTDPRFRDFLNCGESDMETYGRKLRAAHRKQYPTPPVNGKMLAAFVAAANATTLSLSKWARAFLRSNRKDLTLDMLHRTGLWPLQELYGRQPDPERPSGSGPPRLCSMSWWDAKSNRCDMSTELRMIGGPGRAVCEGHEEDLAACPRLWT